jgi:hypothetical protein
MSPPGSPIDPLLKRKSRNRPADDVSVPADQTGSPRSPIGMQSRRITFLVAGALATLTALVVVVTMDDESPALQPVLAVDGWAPYWTLESSAEEISRRAGSMREVSPFWFKVTG